MSDISPTDADAVERDLETTRARLGGHLDQLRDRMTPGQVLDDVVRYFRGKEGADFGRNLLSNVKENPLPAAVTGVGLAWLMATNGRTAVTPASTVARARGLPPEGDYKVDMHRQSDLIAARRRMRAAEESIVRKQGEPEEAFVARREDARGYAIGVTRLPQETHESFAGRIQSFFADGGDRLLSGLHGAKDGLSDAASTAAGALGAYGSGAQSAVSDAASRAGEAFSAGGQVAARTGNRWAAALMESPALMGALSLAAGALLGALVPQSDAEETALAGVAGKVRETATDLARSGMDKGTEVAQSTLEAGTAAVHGHGLAGERSVGALVDAALSGDLASDAKQVVVDVVQAGDEAIRKNLPSETDNPPDKPA